MFGMFGKIAEAAVGMVHDLAVGWREDNAAKRTERSQVRQAELQRDIAVINNQAAQVAQSNDQEHEWDMEAARQAARSWKDEWFTFLLSIPLIICFVPGGAPYALAGFAAADQAPDWYKLAFGAAVAFAFGIRHLVQMFPVRR